MKDFIEKFAEAVDIEENVENLNANTNFRKIEEWSSLAALSVIAMFDEEYGKTISGKEIRAAKTIEDLYNLTK
ncbi:phosphopantetheine-binding protein [Bacteroides intestinalis]|uniref:phosphopantetheine-binding protein n=1 Tax=Bacteroides intestinalis TaxID=329854 RepID=UPI0005C9AEE8|nr:phosphopantetheine-binding protein [Bacteroides intestinalis]